jgi:hypothetical protein
LGDREKISVKEIENGFVRMIVNVNAIWLTDNMFGIYLRPINIEEIRLPMYDYDFQNTSVNNETISKTVHSISHYIESEIKEKNVVTNVEVPQDKKHMGRRINRVEVESESDSDGSNENQVKFSDFITKLENFQYKPDEDTLAARDKMIGKPVLSTLFGLTSITIFENGYVVIGSGFDALPGKLISIQGHADITKKTAVGRTVASLGLIAIGTLPLNIYAPSRRGDLTLTIVTDRETKVLHVGYASDIALEALRKLDAVGNAIISGNKNTGASQNTRVADASLSAEILKLNQLYEAGILTQEEFTAAKSKLLG